MALFKNSWWRRPPCWKIHKRAYLGQFLTSLHQIWCADIYGQFKCHQRQKSTFRKFKMSRPPSWKIHKRVYLSQFYIDLHQIWYVYRYGRYKCHQGSTMQFLENQDGGGRNSGKYTKRHISANSWSICTKFCMLVFIGNVGVQKSTFWKFKIAAFWKYTKGYLLANSWQICTKFMCW